jgi:putative transposase
MNESNALGASASQLRNSSTALTAPLARSFGAANVILKLTGNSRTVEVRQVKYLNNILEQDHRFVKRITAPMMGFKAFHSVAATLAGIETAHMIRKGQFDASGMTAFQQFVWLAA